MANKDYCQRMAHYGAWQNGAMAEAFDALGDEALQQERGAFFGSILKTANHLLWGDQLWIGRFDGGEGMTLSTEEGLALTTDLAEWKARRIALDQRIIAWADGVDPEMLGGQLQWRTVAGGIDMEAPIAMCVTQLFNHATHHRGQIHAMVTMAGHDGWVTDVPFMPKYDSFD